MTRSGEDKAARNAAIVAAVAAGVSKRVLARRYGVNRRRIRVICEQWRRAEAVAAGWEALR